MKPVRSARRDLKTFGWWLWTWDRWETRVTPLTEAIHIVGSTIGMLRSICAVSKKPGRWWWKGWNTLALFYIILFYPIYNVWYIYIYIFIHSYYICIYTHILDIVTYNPLILKIRHLFIFSSAAQEAAMGSECAPCESHERPCHLSRLRLYQWHQRWGASGEHADGQAGVVHQHLQGHLPRQRILGTHETMAKHYDWTRVYGR